MIQERKWMVVNRKSSLRCRDAADERQYMLSGDYEVYEKVGEPVGAVSFHYHDFYELIYIIEGEFSSLIEDRAVRMRKGDFRFLQNASGERGRNCIISPFIMRKFCVDFC